MKELLALLQEVNGLLREKLFHAFFLLFHLVPTIRVPNLGGQPGESGPLRSPPRLR